MENTKEKIEEKKSQLLDLTHAFDEKHLNKAYTEVIDQLIEKMARKREVPFLKGKIDIWAAATIHALGTINFLFDKNNMPYVPVSQIYDFFETKQSTTSQRSKTIRDMFKMSYFDSTFAISSVEQNNPFNNLTEINDFLFPNDMLEKQTLTDWELRIIQILGDTKLDKNAIFTNEELVEHLEVTPARLNIVCDYLQANLKLPFSATVEQEIESNKVAIYDVYCTDFNHVQKVDDYLGILVNITQDGNTRMVVPLAEVFVEEEHHNAPFIGLYHAWFWT